MALNTKTSIVFCLVLIGLTAITAHAKTITFSCHSVGGPGLAINSWREHISIDLDAKTITRFQRVSHYSPPPGVSGGAGTENYPDEKDQITKITDQYIEWRQPPNLETEIGARMRIDRATLSLSAYMSGFLTSNGSYSKPRWLDHWGQCQILENQF